MAKAIAIIRFVIVAVAAISGCTLGSHRESQRSLLKSGDALGRQILIIAHRGASGHLPEHTLEAYAKAIEMGADYIEPDLVSTKDGVLIARHENDLTESTNVAQRFPNRKRKKTIDGTSKEGFFSEDFTLKEIKSLRARERLPFRDQSHNDQFLVPTLDEILALVRRETSRTGRVIGVYPELKHSTYHHGLGFDVEAKLLASLTRFGYTTPQSPVFIQSFEVSNLKRLRKITPVKLIQLVDEPQFQPGDVLASRGKQSYADMLTEKGLAEIKSYADGVGLYKRHIVPQQASGSLGPETQVVELAHKQGLLVHAWTFRSEARYLATDYGNDPQKEYFQYFRLGVDGFFSDFPDAAVSARAAWMASQLSSKL